MKKQYIKPDVDVVEVDAEGVMSNSGPIKIQSDGGGNGEDALSNTYRNNLWN